MAQPRPAHGLPHAAHLHHGHHGGQLGRAAQLGLELQLAAAQQGGLLVQKVLRPGGQAGDVEVKGGRG